MCKSTISLYVLYWCNIPSNIITTYYKLQHCALKATCKMHDLLTINYSYTLTFQYYAHCTCLLPCNPKWGIPRYIYTLPCKKNSIQIPVLVAYNCFRCLPHWPAYCYLVTKQWRQPHLTLHLTITQVQTKSICSSLTIFWSWGVGFNGNWSNSCIVLFTFTQHSKDLLQWVDPYRTNGSLSTHQLVVPHIT